MKDIDMDPKQLILAVDQIAEEKNLPFETVQEALEQALAAAYRKDYGTKEQRIRTEINKKTGEYKLFLQREVVDEVEDPETEISAKEAKDKKVGDIVEERVNAGEFGRVAAQTAKQVILQKLREAEREVVFSEYTDKIGTILNGTIQRIEPRVVYVELGKAQGILPKSEQIPNEYYRNGQRLKVFLKDVESSPKGPQLILSRANADFVKLLFAREVPEMENDAVEIKSIAREAGARTKLAVTSNVPGVDPVGTFVGGHGTRVQAVMGEIGEEKIDIVMYSETPEEFITNALSPTKIKKVELNEGEKKAVVRVDDDQLSIAIGKQGQNVRLASKLTEWQLDIVSDSGKEVPATQTTKEQKKKYTSKSDLESSLLSAIESTEEEDQSDSEENDQTKDES